MPGAAGQAKVGNADHLGSMVRRNANLQGSATAHGCHDIV
jgi:hypothetical protein